MKDDNKKEYAIDKVTAPPPGGPQYDYVGGLLEAQKKDFKMFGELLHLVSNKLDRVEKRTDSTFEEVAKLKVETTEMNDKLDDHTGRLDRIEDKLGIREPISV